MAGEENVGEFEAAEIVWFSLNRLFFGGRSSVAVSLFVSLIFSDKTESNVLSNPEKHLNGEYACLI